MIFSRWRRLSRQEAIDLRGVLCGPKKSLGRFRSVRSGIIDLEEVGIMRKMP